MTEINKVPFILGVDLDGVTAKYHNGFGEWLVKVKGWNPEDVKPPTCYNFVKSDGWPFKSIKEFLELHKEFVACGGFRKLEPMEGAVEVLNRLASEGVTIRIVTHRIIGNSPGQAIKDTIDWLSNESNENDLSGKPLPLREGGAITYHSFTVAEDKENIHCDLIIDDAPSNIESIRANGGHVVVFDQPYNQMLDDPRVHNWHELYDFVKKLREEKAKQMNVG